MASNAVYKLKVAGTLGRTGMFKPVRPDKAVRALGALRKWGPTPAAAYTGSAIRYPDRLALVDERGALTFKEVDERTNAMAHALARAGIRAGDGVAIMCRNHRGFVEATTACAKLGASVLYLNTAFAGPQITDVLKREAPAGVIYDEEFCELVREGAKGHKRFVSWLDPGSTCEDPLLEDLMHAPWDASPLTPPRNRAHGDPNLGHDGDAEGRGAQAARRARSGRVFVLEDPAEGAGDHDDRRSPLSLLGLCPLHDGAAAGLDARAAPPL